MTNVKRYRLYTENKPNLGELASKYFDAFTIYPAVGYWKGEKEKSAIIEVINLDGTPLANYLFCLLTDIKRENNQEAVMLTEDTISADLY